MIGVEILQISQKKRQNGKPFCLYCKIKHSSLFSGFIFSRCSGCFSLRSFCSSSGFFTTTAGSLGWFGFRFNSFAINFVEIYEFDEGLFGIIPHPRTEFNDAGITTRATGNFRSNGVEEFGNGFFVLQVTEYDPTVMGIVILCFGDKGLSEHAQCLGFSQGGNDTLVFDQADGQVGQQGLAVGFLTAQVVDFVSVTHDFKFYRLHRVRICSLH